jgi:hypothetical protein
MCTRPPSQNIYLRYHPQLNSLPLYALRTQQMPDASPSERAAVELPEWAELFGSPEACEVSPCESALSPSAYLVDIMDFLRRAGDGTGKNGLDYLLERRPDLGLLQLNCENTETTLPKIDLVNEILEQIIAFSSDGKTIPTTDVCQTTWESELLEAMPEHLEPAAYDKLLQAVYPFNRLPFHLWLEESRRFLRQMGVERHELMRVMPALPGVNPITIAVETLGMTPREGQIVRSPVQQASALSEYWGMGGSRRGLVARLRQVQALLQQAEIDYDTLLRLLNARS